MSRPNQHFRCVASFILVLILAQVNVLHGAVISYEGYGLFRDGVKSGIVAYPGEGGGTVDTWIPGGHKLTFYGYGDTVTADPMTHVYLGSFTLNQGTAAGNFDGLDFDLRVSQGALHRQPVLVGRISGAISGAGERDDWSTLLIEFDRPDFELDGVQYVLQDTSIAFPASGAGAPIFATIFVPEPGVLALLAVTSLVIGRRPSRRA